MLICKASPGHGLLLQVWLEVEGAGTLMEYLSISIYDVMFGLDDTGDNPSFLTG